MSGATPKLRWRCRRGMRELDIALERFLDNAYASLSEADKQVFDALLELPDPELYAYLMGRDEPRDRRLAALFARIRASVSLSP